MRDFDGGNQRLLTTTPRGGADSHPDWSPDGKQIAFERVTDFTPGHGRSSIVVVDAETGEEQAIVPAEMNAIRASWSPAGDLIAFSSNAESFDVESANVWVVAPDGSGLQQITHASGDGQAYLPDWSPDGEWLVFVRHSAVHPGAHLAVVSADASTECSMWADSGGAFPADPDWGP